MVNAPAMLEGYLASSDILACYALSGELQKEEMPIQAKTIVYDQPIIDAYKPDIKRGKMAEKCRYRHEYSGSGDSA